MSTNNRSLTYDKPNARPWTDYRKSNSTVNYFNPLKVCIAFTLFLLLSFTGNAQTNLEAVTYCSGKFVAITSNGSLLSSSDGITWTSVAAPSGNWQDIIY